mmetsp:Transcript_46152/g.108025  ORF Transcript_46152/g.108025 Transcript_46152/m.108025 type:complete len:87 (-) Transcript_46152:18-278(-)
MAAAPMAAAPRAAVTEAAEEALAEDFTDVATPGLCTFVGADTPGAAVKAIAPAIAAAPTAVAATALLPRLPGISVVGGREMLCAIL